MAASSTDYTLCRLQPGHVHLPMLRQIYQVMSALRWPKARADVLASGKQSPALWHRETWCTALIPGLANWRKPVFRRNV